MRKQRGKPPAAERRNTMPKREKIICSCGGRLSRPLPDKCPHCGARIIGARQNIWPLVWPVLVIILMFAALVGILWWVAGAS